LRARRREAFAAELAAWHGAAAGATEEAAAVSTTPPDAAACLAPLAALLPGPGGLVGAYASYRHVPPTWPVIEALCQAGRRVLVPAAGAALTELTWAEVPSAAWAAAASREREAPGLVPPEPPGPRLPAAVLADAGLVIVPALAVDHSGTRLGQGGGWDDRSLLHVPPGVPVVALVNEAELLPPGTLPREAHDRPATHALTPRGLVALG
jgi:5-formyltetrahydrofolate cyclo-ligase